MMKTRITAPTIFVYCSLFAFMLGCGQSNPAGRFSVSGMVKFNDQPVPAGQIRFEPNAAAGGKGPVGFAKIRAGRFNSADQGKGPVPGPTRVIITGYVSDQPNAAALFPQYKTKLELSAENDELEFDVPKN